MYYALISTNRSPLEELQINFTDFMNKDFRSEVKERINHVLIALYD